MPVLFKIAVVMLLTVSASLSASALSARPAISSSLQAEIPAATEPCTEEEARWWQELRAAGSRFVEASRRREQAVHEATSLAHKRGRVLAEGDDGLSPSERNKLDADLGSARKSYSNLLRTAQEKSYRAPIQDIGYNIIIYRCAPIYTERARRNQTMGRVILRVEFRADGTIGTVDVLRGIGDGLDEVAINAIRQMVFLPVTQNRVFVTVSKAVAIEFSLR